MSILKTIIFLILISFTTTALIANDLTNPKKQEEKLRELLEFGDDAEANVSTLLELMKTSKPKISKMSFKVILNIGTELQIAKASFWGLNSSDKEIKSLSDKAFKKLTNKEIAPIIIKMLESDKKDIQRLGIDIASKLNCKKTIPALSKLLFNKSETQSVYVNQLSAKALGNIKTKESVNSLIKALFFKKQDETTFKYARNALFRLRNIALEEVINILNGKNKEFDSFINSLTPKVSATNVTLTLISIINELGNESHLTILEKYMENTDLEIRLEAELGMGILGSPKSISVLIKRYNKLKKELIKEKDENKIKNTINELININQALVLINTKKTQKHIVKVINSKPLKINKKKYNDLSNNAAIMFSKFATARYYKLYKKLYRKERNKRYKRTALLNLKMLELSKQCKSKVKCYANYFNETKKKKSSVKFTRKVNDIVETRTLNVFRKEKASYMLAQFKKGKSKDLALKTVFEKVLFDSNPSVRKAGEFVINRLATKDDLKSMEEVIKKAQKFKYLEEAEFLFEKILSKLIGK